MPITSDNLDSKWKSIKGTINSSILFLLLNFTFFALLYIYYLSQYIKSLLWLYNPVIYLHVQVWQYPPLFSFEIFLTRVFPEMESKQTIILCGGLHKDTKKKVIPDPQHWFTREHDSYSHIH